MFELTFSSVASTELLISRQSIEVSSTHPPITADMMPKLTFCLKCHSTIKSDLPRHDHELVSSEHKRIIDRFFGQLGSEFFRQILKPAGMVREDDIIHFLIFETWNFDLITLEKCFFNFSDYLEFLLIRTRAIAEYLDSTTPDEGINSYFKVLYTINDSKNFFYLRSIDKFACSYNRSLPSHYKKTPEISNLDKKKKWCHECETTHFNFTKSEFDKQIDIKFLIESKPSRDIIIKKSIPEMMREKIGFVWAGIKAIIKFLFNYFWMILMSLVHMFQRRNAHFFIFFVWFWIPFTVVAVCIHTYPTSMSFFIFMFSISLIRLSKMASAPERNMLIINSLFLISVITAIFLLWYFDQDIFLMIAQLDVVMFALVLFMFCYYSLSYYSRAGTTPDHLNLKGFLSKIDLEETIKEQDNVYKQQKSIKRLSQRAFEFDFANNFNFIYSFVIILFSMIISFEPISGLLGYGNSQVIQFLSGKGYEVIFSYIWFIETIIFFAKVIYGQIVNTKMLKLIKDLENAIEICEFIATTPEAILEDKSILSSIEKENSIKIDILIFSTREMSQKYSRSYKAQANYIINAFQHQLQFKTKKDYNFKDLQDQIKLIAIRSKNRIVVILNEYNELYKLLEYKFLGKLKVDKTLILKLGIAAVTALASFVFSLTQNQNSSPAPTPSNNTTLPFNFL